MNLLCGEYNNTLDDKGKDPFPGKVALYPAEG